MLKNWLIRTKSNHILGPVSKAKVTELYKNGSVKPDDEFCSGNGYWFFVKEKALIEKYLLGDEPQEFNPISEANDVLTENHSTAVINLNEFNKSNEKAPATAASAAEEEFKLPESDDLDYPDLGSAMTKAQEPPKVPVTEMAAPAHSPATPEKKSENVTITPPKRREVTPKVRDVSPVTEKANAGEQSKKLYMVAIILMVVIIIAILYRKNVVNKKVKLSSLIMSEAYAQTSTEEEKKSILISL